MMKRKINFYYILTLTLLFSACSSTKFVPEGSYLLDKVTIISDRKEIKPSQLKPYLKQKPNASALGIYKIQLHLYSLSGRDSTKWINKWVRRSGTAPVIYDSLLTNKTEVEFQRLLQNKGYLQAQVSSVAGSKKKKRMNVTYTIASNSAYVVDNLRYNIPNPELSRLVSNDSHNALIRLNRNFDTDQMSQERERLATMIRNHGYYDFDANQVSYLADTTRHPRKVDLTLNINPTYQPVAGASAKEWTKHTIGNVYIIMDNLGVSGDTVNADTVFYRNTFVVDNGVKWIDPKALVNSCYIVPGLTYTDRMVENTRSSFSRFTAIKYVNIRFEEVQRQDSIKQDCYIHISEGKSSSVTAELTGTNTAGDLGFAASTSYQHRNLFKRGETFSAKIRGAYENITGTGEGIFANNFIEFGGDVSLTFPKFLFPFLSYKTKRRFRPTSEISVNYNYQQRPEYQRVFTGGTWSYKWNYNNQIRHTIDLLNLSFVNVPYMDPDFEDYIFDKNPMVWYSFDKHFIMGAAYRFYTTNQVQNRFQWSVYSIRFGVESAGNLLYGISNMMGHQASAQDSLGRYHILGLPYSQYVKFDLDLVRSINFSEKSSLNFRAAVGAAIPYGNSSIVPYEKRYYGGGANGVRGWSVRSLGPGNYESESDVFDYAFQLGDMRLDLSVEHRAKLFWKFESALFFDAGNVWNINQDSFLGLGVFDLKTFYKQIAMAYGVGLRLNFDYFIIRLDWGFKLYDPAGAGRWVKPFSGRDNALHFAIGYPF